MRDDFKNLFKDGLTQFQNGKFLKSESIFLYLLKYEPKNFTLYTYLIPSLINQNKLKDAKKYSEELYQLSSHFKETSLIYLGIISQKLQKVKESVDYFHQSLKINPKNYQSLLNLGVAYHKLNNNRKAIQYTKESIKINKHNSVAYQNIASYLEDENQIDEAIEYLQYALSINKNDYNSIHALSLLQLLKLDYKSGLNNYEKRFLSSQQKLKYSQFGKLSLNSKIKGKKILVWHEQGLGDTIQFSRLADMLSELGGIVTFEVQPPLENFLKKQFKFEISSDVQNKQFDYQIPLLSLLKYFNIDENNIPKLKKTFNCDKDKFLFWKNLIPLKNDKINIGLSVSGNKNHKKEYRRCIPLEKFNKFTDQSRIFLIQKEISIEDRKIVDQNNEIFFLGENEYWNDFTDTSAIVENMDVIISIDTSLIHLSGSMNKKSYLLLSNPPDWRWGHRENKIKWYDNVKILRQNSPRNWVGLIDSLRHLLNQVSDQ